MKKLYISILLAASGSVALAQQKTNSNAPAALELRQQRGLWERSGNPAGMKLDGPYRYSQIKAGYEAYDGDFRRPQEGNSGNRQIVETEGRVLLDSFYLAGTFTYRRESIQDANFNASIIDPFRGMPYIIADANPSDWVQQHYDLGFRLATPAYGRWSWGLAGSYKAASGAKQRDVRTENNFYSLSVTPGVVYSLSPKHHLGLNLRYANTKEEATMKNVNTYVDQTYYELLGLGTAIGQVGSGRVNNYEGDAWGGGVQYQYKGKLNFLANVNYLVEGEDLTITFTTPRKGGTVIRKSWQAGVEVQQESGKLLQSLGAQYYNRHIDGIQYVTQRDNSAEQTGWVTLAKYIRSTFKTQELGLRYSITGKRGEEDYGWTADLSAHYSKLDDAYLLPHSWKNAENLLIAVGGKKNFRLSGDRESRLQVGLRAGVNRNLSGEYQYNGQHPEYPTVTGLETNDWRYLTSDFVRVELPVTYSVRIGKEQQRVLFVNAFGRYTKAGSFDFDNRYTFGGSVGLNF